MVTDLRRRPVGHVAAVVPPAGPARGGRLRKWWPFVVLAALVLAAVAGTILGGDDRSPAHRVEAGAGGLPAPSVSVLGTAQEAAPATAAAGATGPATTARPITTVARVRPTAAPASAPATVTTQPATTATAAPVPTNAASTPASTAAPSTSTTVVGCRNSTDPACGPFRFDPQPGADSPMTVGVSVEPAAPKAGQEVVFRLTLTDADGVSFNATLFGYGDGGIAGADYPPCEKFGAWDPPARDGAAATKTVVVKHTYANQGTYAVSFSFEAGPFSCVDSVTGRGDRPYASSATGTATVVVG